MISPEVKKFLTFRNKLIELLDGSFDVIIDDHDSCQLRGNPTFVADRVIDLIKEYEENEKVEN